MKTPDLPTSRINQQHRTWRTPVICLCLGLMVAAAYFPVCNFEFLNYDDDLYVTENPTVQAGLTTKGIRWAMTFNEIGHWHPLTWISHMLDCELFGLNAGGHHLTNVLIHAVTAILLFLVLKQMTGLLWPSAFAAALFAIHPLRVESVAWVSERKDVLSGLFFMLTLGAYVDYVRKPKSLIRYTTVVLLFALGLMSKNMLVTLPFVLLLLDYWPLRRFDSSTHNDLQLVFKRLIVEKIPLFLLSVASCVVTSFAPETISAAGRWTILFRIENALVSYVTYLWQTIVPTGLAVPYMPLMDGLELWRVIGAFCLLAAITLAAILLRRRHPYLTVGWFWFLGMLVPVIGFVQISYYTHADRYTYLPQIGLAMAIAWLAKELTARWRWQRRVLTIMAFLMISMFMWRTANQVLVWRNNITLWTHTLEVMPDNTYAHNGLGIAFATKGRLDKAVQHYQAALKSNPNFVQARNNLGNALLEQRKTEEAIVQFTEALRIEPRFAPTYNNLGNALGVAGRTDEAIAQYQQAIWLKPDYALAYENLGNSLTAQNRIEEALVAYREAFRLKPLPAVAHYQMGIALGRQGKYQEAIVQYETALKLQPNYPDAHNNLGNLFAATERSKEAAVHYQEALKLQPDNIKAHNNYGGLLLHQGRVAEAIAQYEEVLRLNPSFVPVLRNIVWIRASCANAAFRDGTKAIELAQRAVELTEGKDAATLDAFAAAQAEVGHFPEAIETAKKARSLALTAGQGALVNQIELRLKLYTAGSPYRLTP